MRQRYGDLDHIDPPAPWPARDANMVCVFRGRLAKRRIGQRCTLQRCFALSHCARPLRVGRLQLRGRTRLFKAHHASDGKQYEGDRRFEQRHGAPPRERAGGTISRQVSASNGARAPDCASGRQSPSASNSHRWVDPLASRLFGFTRPESTRSLLCALRTDHEPVGCTSSRSRSAREIASCRERVSSRTDSSGAACDRPIAGTTIALARASSTRTIRSSNSVRPRRAVECNFTGPSGGVRRGRGTTGDSRYAGEKSTKCRRLESRESLGCHDGLARMRGAARPSIALPRALFRTQG